MDSPRDEDNTQDILVQGDVNEPVNETEEDPDLSSAANDVYSGDNADLSAEDASQDTEEHNEHLERPPSMEPRTPRAEENSTTQDSTTMSPVTPISWKDASKSMQTPTRDTSMPSFTDKAMLDQIELNAKQSASNLVVLVHHLRTQLATISSLSVQYMSLHKSCVEGVSDQMHEGIASSQKLILKAQSLNTELKKVYIVQQDIKDTKKMLGQLEKLVEKMTKN
jgi:hypothetical protein